jgi:hypothetical protein
MIDVVCARQGPRYSFDKLLSTNGVCACEVKDFSRVTTMLLAPPMPIAYNVLALNV